MVPAGDNVNAGGKNKYLVAFEELFYLVKRNGYTTIKRAKDDPQIVAYMDAGDKLGRIWKDGLFEGIDPA